MQSQSLFFTLFGDYIMNHGGSVRAASLVKMMGEFGLSASAVRAGLFRLSQSGLVNVRRNGKQSHYMLSAAGLRHLRDGTRRVYQPERHRWDGLWRLFIYTISEARREQRDLMRRELQWHGMAPMAQSTWISPNPLEDVLQELIEEFLREDVADIIVGHRQGNPHEIVQRCWDLDAVRTQYVAFLRVWQPFTDLGSNLEPSVAFVRRIELVHAYRKFLNIDPNLPEDLLPQPWIGYDAYDLFNALHAQWAPTADRFFLSVFEP